MNVDVVAPPLVDFEFPLYALHGVVVVGARVVDVVVVVVVVLVLVDVVVVDVVVVDVVVVVLTQALAYGSPNSPGA